MLRIGAVVLNSDPGVARDFWGDALGYEAGRNPDSLVPTSDGAPEVHLDATDRTHLDLWTDGPEEQAAEVERLVGLGARRVEWTCPDDADFVVLADPAGTLFCVVDTSRR